MTGQETNKFIYNVSPEQRAALRAPGEDARRLKDMFESLRKTFDEEGLVLVRGLLEDGMREQLRAAGEKVESMKFAREFTSLQFGPVFNEEERAYREVALNSAIPAMIARVLLDVDGEEENGGTLRLLKDCFMAKGKEGAHCGWHVDDAVFWPVDSDASGVNVWLALDPIPSRLGGGLAVSPGSHTADWRHEAYKSLGSTPTILPEGMDPAGFKKIFTSTCAMESLNRDVNSRIESSKVVFDYEAGDCLFCNRWLFHRSVPINEEGLKHYSDGSSLKRYTIRYERGNARLIKGLSFEPSILMNGENSGKTLDEVCKRDGPFYPQCWPPLKQESDQEQVSGMVMLAREAIPAATVKKMEIVKGLTTST